MRLKSCPSNIHKFLVAQVAATLIVILCSGCYHSTPKATWLDPLSMWRNTAQSQVVQPIVESNVPNGSVIPFAAIDQQTAANQLAGNTPLPGNAIQPVAAVEFVPNCTSPMSESCGDISTGGCACCTPTATWCPPGMPQYCVNPQEYLCDGGDKPPEVHVATDGQPLGLGTQDTVVTYDNRDGNPEVSASNCVCVYAPRFAAVRKVDAAALGERAIAAVGYDRPLAPTPMDSRIPGVIVSDIQGPINGRLVRGPDAYRERMQPLPVSGDQSLVLARDILEALADISLLEIGKLKDADLPLIQTGAMAAIIWTGRDVVDVLIDEQKAAVATMDRTPQELKIYEVRGSGKLRICKVADRTAARVGDPVTFVIRVDNVGDAAVNNIVISDNLTTRLEYVADTQACTKGAVFTSTANEAGSTTVSWKLTDNMKVGEGCIIRFRCRVR